MQVTLFKQEDYSADTNMQRDLTIGELAQAIDLYREIQTQVLPIDLADKDLVTIYGILQHDNCVEDLSFDDNCEYIDFTYSIGSDVDIRVTVSRFDYTSIYGAYDKPITRLAKDIEIYVKHLDYSYEFNVTGKTFELKTIDR